MNNNNHQNINTFKKIMNTAHSAWILYSVTFSFLFLTKKNFLYFSLLNRNLTKNLSNSYSEKKKYIVMVVENPAHVQNPFLWC